MFSAPRAAARILVVELSDEAPGGNFLKGLTERGARLAALRPAEGEALPASPDGFDGLVVLGGPQHAFDDATSPFFPTLLELMRRFDADGKPVAGICLGCQLLARAHGATVHTMDFLEFGFIRHPLTPEGKADPVVGGVEPPALMEFHEDSFDLPAGASLLMRGERCANQCFKVGHASYGFQFHIEANMPTVANWIHLLRTGGIEEYRGRLQEIDAAWLERFSAGLEPLVRDSERFCDRVSGRWLALTWQ